jgi:hypothetical protein
MKIRYSYIYPRINFLLTIILPVLSMLNGDTIVLYIVYLYWWQELLATIADGWYYKKKKLFFSPNFCGFRSAGLCLGETKYVKCDGFKILLSCGVCFIFFLCRIIIWSVSKYRFERLSYHNT